MVLRQTWLIGLVVLWQSLVSPLVGAEENPAPTPPPAIIPGTTEPVQNMGLAALAVSPTLINIILPKELADLNWSLYAAQPENPAIGEAYMHFFSKHINNYCSPNSGVEKNYKDPTNKIACNNDNAPQLQHADLKISSLLAPTIYDPKNPATLAEEIIRTLTTPFPNLNISSLVQTGLTNNADITYVARVMAQHAAINAARNSLNEIYSARKPVASPIKPTTEDGKNISFISIMQHEANARFTNQKWYTAVKSLPQDDLLRELVYMEAYRLWSDYNRYRQNERMEALLAVMTVQLAEQTLSNINANHQTTSTPSLGE